MRGLAAAVRRLDAQPNQGYAQVGHLTRKCKQLFDELHNHAHRAADALIAGGPRLVQERRPYAVHSLMQVLASMPVEEVERVELPPPSSWQTEAMNAELAKALQEIL